MNENQIFSNEIKQLKSEKENTVLSLKTQNLEQETKIKELEKLVDDLKEKDNNNKLKIKEVQKELEDNYKIIENLEKDINQIKVNKEYNKEKPGTSFLFSLNNKKFFNIKPGEIATDNRPEKLCFGRTYYYNDNESNWLIYIPRDEFLGVNCKFGNKESSFGEIKSSDIVGAISSYHLSDVEIFEVKFDNDDNDLDDNEDNDDNSKNIIMNNKKDKIEEKDETAISDKNFRLFLILYHINNMYQITALNLKMYILLLDELKILIDLYLELEK